MRARIQIRVRNHGFLVPKHNAATRVDYARFTRVQMLLAWVTPGVSANPHCTVLGPGRHPIP